MSCLGKHVHVYTDITEIYTTSSVAQQHITVYRHKCNTTNLQLCTAIVVESKMCMYTFQELHMNNTSSSMLEERYFVIRTGVDDVTS